jgi:hypothetical protein
MQRETEAEEDVEQEVFQHRAGGLALEKMLA